MNIQLKTKAMMVCLHKNILRTASNSTTGLVFVCYQYITTFLKINPLNVSTILTSLFSSIQTDIRLCPHLNVLLYQWQCHYNQIFTYPLYVGSPSSAAASPEYTTKSILHRYNLMLYDLGMSYSKSDYEGFVSVGITSLTWGAFKSQFHIHRFNNRNRVIGSERFDPTQLRDLHTDRSRYPGAEKGEIPKSKWSTYILPHLVESTFQTELETLIRGLKSDTFHAIYVTLYGKGNYYSLGSQFIINNQADLGQIMTHLHNQYELLQNRYDLSPTSRSLVKVRELRGYSSKVNEFFFDRMETNPFTQPHKSSGSIMNEQYYPYIDLSALSINKIEGLQIVEESALHVKFLWVSEGRTYFVEYDKIMRQGTSSNIDRQIPFSDTELSDGLIKRSSQGFEIVYNPETRKVLNYYFHTRLDTVLGSKSVENPTAFPELKTSQELHHGRALTAADTQVQTPNSAYGVLDLETLHTIHRTRQDRQVQDLEIVSVGFYTRSATGEPISKYYQIDKYSSLGAMLESVFKDVEETGVKYVYVHNWAGFDSLFLLKYLQAHYELNPFTFDGQTLSLRVHKKGAKKLTQPLYTIKDSLKLLPLSQSTLTHSFAVSTQKGSFPHYFDPREHTLDGSINYVGLLPSYEYYEPKRVSPSAYAALAQEYSSQPWDYVKELEKYQMDDCKSLHEVLDKYTTLTYQTLGIDVHKNLSIPGSTYKLWQGLEHPKLISSGRSVYQLPRNVTQLLRDSYYGGHVDVYLPYVESSGKTDWHHYDVNSLYPRAMLESLPTGKPVYVKYPVWDSNFFGFVNATVTCPEDIPYPTLPKRQGYTVIFPVGTFTGTWFSEELRYAVSKGYKVEQCHWGLIFDKTEGLFSTLIGKLNSIKVESTATKNTALRTISKLYMNSLYGYFGLRDIKETTGYYQGSESEDIHLLYAVKKVIPFEDGSEMITHSRLPLLESIEQFDPTSKHLKELETEEEGIQVNVSIASAITAYSRVLINDYKYKIHSEGGKVAYSDTDSLVTDVRLSDNQVSSTELGKMKLENVIEKGYYLAPKLYYESVKEGAVVVKSRGYSGDLTESDYARMYEGGNLELEQDKWFRLSTEHRVQIRTVTLRLRSVMSKREKVYDATGRWVGTRPLRLGEAIPLGLDVTSPTPSPTITTSGVTSSPDMTIIDRVIRELKQQHAVQLQNQESQIRKSLGEELKTLLAEARESRESTELKQKELESEHQATQAKLASTLASTENLRSLLEDSIREERKYTQLLRDQTNQKIKTIEDENARIRRESEEAVQRARDEATRIVYESQRSNNSNQILVDLLMAQNEKQAAQINQLTAQNEKLVAQNEKLVAQNEKQAAQINKLVAHTERQSAQIEVLQSQLSALLTHLGVGTKGGTGASGAPSTPTGRAGPSAPAPTNEKAKSSADSTESGSLVSLGEVVPKPGGLLDQTQKVFESRVSEGKVKGLGPSKAQEGDED